MLRGPTGPWPSPLGCEHANEALWLWKKALRDFGVLFDPARQERHTSPGLCKSQPSYSFKQNFATSHLCLHKDDSRGLMGLRSPTHVVLPHLLRSQATPRQGHKCALVNAKPLETQLPQPHPSIPTYHKTQDSVPQSSLTGRRTRHWHGRHWSHFGRCLVTAAGSG